MSLLPESSSSLAGLAAKQPPEDSSSLAGLAAQRLPEFPYNQQILDLYMRDPTNPMWLKYTKLQQWQKEINQYILALYKLDISMGETYYAMQDRKAVLAQYD